MTPELQELLDLYAAVLDSGPAEQHAAATRFRHRCLEISALTRLKSTDIENHVRRAWRLIQASASRRSGRPRLPSNS